MDHFVAGERLMLYSLIPRIDLGIADVLERVHREAWPEMLELFKSVRISEYSISAIESALCLTSRPMIFRLFRSGSAITP
jgi:hypothetical protein